MFGADVVMHSGSKFIGGHADLLIGLAVAADEDLSAKLRQSRVLGGATPGGMEAFLAARGARTMALRVRAGQESAGELARRLDAHPEMTRVRGPAPVAVTRTPSSSPTAVDVYERTGNPDALAAAVRITTLIDPT